MHHPKKLPQQNQSEKGLNLINPILTPVTNKKCKIFSHIQVHPIPNQGIMEAGPAPVIANSPVQQDTQQLLQRNPFVDQPQQESQLDLVHVQPELIHDHQLQPEQQDPSNSNEKSQTHNHQSSSSDSVNSSQDDEVSDASLSLQQLDDQSVATDATMGNTSANSSN